MNSFFKFCLCFSFFMPSAFGGWEELCRQVITPHPDQRGAYITNNPQIASEDNVLWVAHRLIDEEKSVWGVERIDGEMREWIYTTDRALSDVVLYEDKLLVLSGQDVLQLSKSGDLLGQYSLTHSSGAVGRSMALDGDDLYIAQGQAGLVRFDLLNKRIVWRTNLAEVFRDGHRSFPTAVVPQNNMLYVVMTGGSVAGFNGVLMASSENGAVILSQEYDRRRAGVIDPRARAQFIGDRLVINNGGWIHIVTKAQIQGRRALTPRWVAVRVGGRDNPHYMMLSSGFILEGDTLKACGYEFDHPSDGGRPVRFSRYFEVPL